MKANIKRNEALDILRGSAVILVVFIHIRLPGICGDFAAYLGGLCNALFFLLSGYFAYQNDNRKLALKALRSFSMCTMTYILYALFYTKSIVKILANMPGLLIANVKYCGNMWFAIALSYAYLLYIACKKWGSRMLLLIAILFLGIHVFLCNLYPEAFNNILQSLFYGCPMFVLGTNLASNYKKISEIRINWLYVVLVGVLLNFSSIIFEGVEVVHRIGCIVYATAFFIWAITYDKTIKNELLKTIGKEYYLYFYIFQYVTIERLKSIRFPLISPIAVEWILPFLTIICLYFESVLISLVKRRILGWRLSCSEK